VRTAQRVATQSTVPNEFGRLDAIKIKSLVNANPSVSKLRALINALPDLENLVAPGVKAALEMSRVVMAKDMEDLAAAINAIETGPVRAAAVARAKADMARPREIITTMRTEVNRYAFSLVGLIDSGRLWPVPMETVTLSAAVVVSVLSTSMLPAGMRSIRIQEESSMKVVAPYSFR
jgi:hypothetical protein